MPLTSQSNGLNSIQTHYRTAYGPGSFPSSQPLSSQTTKNFNNQNENTGGSGSRIKVAVRVRPLLENEKNQGHQCTILKYPNQNEIQIGGDDGQGNNQRAKSFKFDQVLTNNCSQSDLYSNLGISNLVQKVIEGYHSTIFAYGQTGSGKTFTMEGYDFISNFGDSPNKTKAVKPSNDSENIGISQRAIFELFQQIQSVKNNEQATGVNGIGVSKTKHYSVFVSFLQIYNEKVFDLLNQSSINSLGTKKPRNQTNKDSNIDVQKQMQGLRIRWTKKDQFVVENLYVFECQTPEEAIELFKFGSKNRVLASHNLNDLSSRSHTIFTLTVEQQDLRHAGESLTVSKLQLVDLAGSEKQGLTGTTGQQAKESIDINKSLLVLRKVITALTEKKSSDFGNSKLGVMSGGNNGFIPYRESKLTCLLKQSLGGNSYTLMIACLSPSDRYFEENLSTLNYAAKASLISNIPTKNVDPRLIEINEYKKKIYDLEKELRNANDHIQYITQLNDDKQRKISTLETQLNLIKQQDPQLLKNILINDNQNPYDSNANSKLPSISTKNQAHNAHHMKQLRSEVIQKDDNQSSIMNNELNNINITSNDIDLSGNNQQRQSNTPGGVRQTISPSKSAQNYQQINSNSQQQSSNSALSNQQQQLNSKRQTQMNFFIQKDKEKQDAAAERLIHSVNAVTDLLKANTELRETIEKLKNQKEEVDGENFTLQIENQSLRERLELVEGILKNNRNEYDGLVSDQVKDNMVKSNTQYGKFNMNATMDQPPTTIDGVYTELIQLRHKNKALEGRIKQLEVQNFRMTNSNFNNKSSNNSNQSSTNKKNIINQEPLRPMFRGSSLDSTPLNSDREQQHHVQEEDNEDEQDYDDESESQDNQYQNLPPPGHSSKSRSFIVTIDEHNPSMKNTGLIKKRIIKKNLIDKQKRINQTQVVMARGDPYLKRLTLAQNSTPGKLRDAQNMQLPPPSQQSQVPNNTTQQVVPDQRYYTKTNFYTVNTNNQQEDLAGGVISNPRSTYNQSVVGHTTGNNSNLNMLEKYTSSSHSRQYTQNIDMGQVMESNGGAVQPPKSQQQFMLNQTQNAYYNSQGNVYESDYNTVNEVNRRNKLAMQLEPISELKNATDVEFKNYKQIKKKQLQQIKANQQRDGSQVIGNNTKGDLSMVMVMSNLMSKRAGGNPINNISNIVGVQAVSKKKSQSQSATNNKKQKFTGNNEFYF
eukprot:403371916